MSFDPNKKPRLKHLQDVAERVSAELSPVKASIKALEDSTPKKVSDLENDTGYQTATDVAAAVAAADHLTRKIVASVDDIDPEAADATKYVYMVLKSSTKAGDKYDEYMVIEGAVERVGDWTVDLSGYVQKEEGKGLSSNDFTGEEKAKLAKAITEDDMATDEEVAEMLDQVFGTGDTGSEE